MCGRAPAGRRGGRPLARSRAAAAVDRRAVEIRTSDRVLRVWFSVGCKTAMKLREAGFDAKYMNSGHSGMEGGWRSPALEHLTCGRSPSGCARLELATNGAFRRDAVRRHGNG